MLISPYVTSDRVSRPVARPVAFKDVMHAMGTFIHLMWIENRNWSIRGFYRVCSSMTQFSRCLSINNSLFSSWKRTNEVSFARVKLSAILWKTKSHGKTQYTMEDKILVERWIDKNLNKIQYTYLLTMEDFTYSRDKSLTFAVLTTSFTWQKSTGAVSILKTPARKDYGFWCNIHIFAVIRIHRNDFCFPISVFRRAILLYLFASRRPARPFWGSRE